MPLNNGDGFATPDSTPKMHMACDECSKYCSMAYSPCDFFEPLNLKQTMLVHRTEEVKMLRRVDWLSAVRQAIAFMPLLGAKADGTSAKEASAGER
jgi:hypothetical protein